MKWILVVFGLFLFTACPSNNPTDPPQKTYQLTVANGHDPPTFNIYVDEVFIMLIEADTIVRIGKFDENESTHFKSVLSDSPFTIAEDTIASTVNCDSVYWPIGGEIIYYYEQ